MLRKVINQKTGIRVNKSQEGFTLEERLRRMKALEVDEEGVGLESGAPIIYTEKKDGVQPAYDIRTDRFELALEAKENFDKASKAKKADLKVIKNDGLSEKADKNGTDGGESLSNNES